MIVHKNNKDLEDQEEQILQLIHMLVNIRPEQEYLIKQDKPYMFRLLKVLKCL